MGSLVPIIAVLKRGHVITILKKKLCGYGKRAKFSSIHVYDMTLLEYIDR